MTTLKEFEARGITNPDRVVSLFKQYRDESLNYSSNSGKIKSVDDISRNIRAALKENNSEEVSQFVVKVLRG